MKELKGLQRLDLSRCGRVTDAGLTHLKELKGLRTLILPVLLPVFLVPEKPRVRDAGLRELRKSLPDTTITGGVTLSM